MSEQEILKMNTLVGTFPMGLGYTLKLVYVISLDIFIIYILIFVFFFSFPFPSWSKCILCFMLRTFEVYPLPDHTVAFNFIRSKQYHWARCYHRFPRICAAHCFRGLWNHFAGLCARHVAFSRKSGLWNARSAYPRWAAQALILNAILVHGQWDWVRRASEGHG